VLTAAQGWLTEVFDPTSSKASKGSGKSSGRRGKNSKTNTSVSGAGATGGKVNLALNCLSRVMITSTTRNVELPTRKVTSLCKTLGLAASIVENRIDGTDTTGGVSTAHLLRALELQFKFAMLASSSSSSSVASATAAADVNTSINSDGSSASTEESASAVEELCLERMGWTQAVLLAHVGNNAKAAEEPEAKKSQRRKRKTVDNDKPGEPPTTAQHARSREFSLCCCTYFYAADML